MRVLREGSRGPDVLAWQYFLRGQNKASKILATEIFDYYTVAETIMFQEQSPGKITADGVVGPQTYAKAMKLGFNPLEDDRCDDESSPAWPPKPAGVIRLDALDRKGLFGDFKFEAAPVQDNPEAIRILDDWAKTNIVTVSIPQLQGIKGASRSGNVQFHRLAAPQLQRMFQALEERDQLKYLKTWGGTWVPRFIRGSTRTLSPHAWGTAFDCNVAWNHLGTQGALKGREGSVREMVQTWIEFGFFWGGHFRGRPDPMHAEIYKLL